MTTNRTKAPKRCDSCGCDLAADETDRCDGCQYTHEEIVEEKKALPPACPLCTGPGVLLGRLGTLDHFRCRNCGCTFHVTGDHR